MVLGAEFFLGQKIPYLRVSCLSFYPFLKDQLTSERLLTDGRRIQPLAVLVTSLCFEFGFLELVYEFAQQQFSSSSTRS